LSKQLAAESALGRSPDTLPAVRPRTHLSAETKLQIIMGAFIGAWGVLPAITTLLVPLNLRWAGLGLLAFSYGACMHAVTYPCLETVVEVWGAARGRVMVLIGISVYVAAVSILYLGTRMPAGSDPTIHTAFGALYGSVLRMVVASLAATISAQLLDIAVFRKVKAITGRRALWLRNGLSVLTSQVADTAIFYTVAFYGIVPNTVLPLLVFGTILVKASFAAVGIPVVYVLVRWITGEWTAKGDLGQQPVDRRHATH